MERHRRALEKTGGVMSRFDSDDAPPDFYANTNTAGGVLSAEIFCRSRPSVSGQSDCSRESRPCFVSRHGAIRAANEDDLESFSLKEVRPILG